MPVRLARLLILASLAGVGALASAVPAPAASTAEAIGSPAASETQAAIAAIFASRDPALLPRTPIDLGALRPLYAARDFAPIWSASPEAATDAERARTALAGAAEDGLDSNDYCCVAPWPRPKTGRDAAQYDLTLSAMVLRYAHDLRLGRLPPGTVYADASLPAQHFDAASALGTALRTGSLDRFLVDLAPPHPEYQRLKAALAKYRTIAAAGGWPAVPGSTEIKLASDPRVGVLAERLAVEDPVLAALPSPTKADLDSAVRRFQARNGLAVDGRSGRATLEALNVTAATRVMQIEANMERWRWMPRAFEPNYIAVNVPDESLSLIENGTEVLHSPVIVGRPRNPTPILRAQAVAVTANPPWNVPAPIAVKEILPKLRRDPNYLAGENMILVNGPPGDPHGQHIDWSKVTAANFPYRIRQVPGAKNALGSLKLELPNHFDVYLHDTPGKTLFSRDDRALSHGCIRVQQIFPLASLALGGDEAAMEKLNAAIASGITQQFALKTPLPVYVLYWTAMADENGTVEFRRDLYGRDRRLADAIAGRSGPMRIAFFTGGCSPAPN
jgi:L,D-transpeptidase YcbB